MTTSYNYKLSDNSRLATLVKALNPGYRKRSVNVKVTETVTLHQAYWDGGSRTHYHPATFAGTLLRTPLVNAPWPNRPASAEFRLSPDTLVYTHGTFRGKQAIMTIFVSMQGYDREIK